MSTERIHELHEQASERYLNGDYAGAIEAWRNVLGIDPENEEAQDGLTMASQFVGPEPEPVAAAATEDVEHELEQGLKVLDGLDVATMLEPEDVDGATDRPPAPPGVAELAEEDALEGWDTSSATAQAEESVGLEPVHQSSAALAPPVSAAGAELKRRVDDLLSQAKSKAEAGERDEALAVLARLAILDEENPEAAELRAKIEAEGASDLDKVERAIIEGVAAIEADRLDDAERHFQEALTVAPHHREAKHYLEKVAERRASSEEDLLGGAIGDAPPMEDAVAAAVPAEPQLPKPQAAPQTSRAAARPAPEAFDPPPAASPRRLSLPSPKALLVGGGGLLVIVLAIFAVPRMFGGGAKPAPTAAAPVRSPRPAVKTGTVDGAGATPAKPSTPASAATVADGLKEGRARLASRDFGGAVIAFNQTLAIDPTNAEAKAGFEEARDRYKADKEEQGALNTIKLAFRDGEYTSALRLAYRLPPTVGNSRIDGIKLAGWYNLAVVALRAGDCKGAVTQIDEALEIAPLDGDAKALKGLATRYADAVKDRAFFDRVEALAFRPPPES